MIHCDRCQKPIVTSDPAFAGYGQDQAGHRHCYSCCGEQDRERLKCELSGTIIKYGAKLAATYLRPLEVLDMFPI